MNNFYIIPPEQQAEIGLNNSENFYFVVAMKDDPIRNWIIGFDIYEKQEEDPDSPLKLSYAVLRVPGTVTDAEVADKMGLIQNSIQQIAIYIIETLCDTLNYDNQKELENKQSME